MDLRTLGRTPPKVSVVGLGCWQLGADWGDVTEDDALAVLHAAIESGVTFLDTADVYGDGRSEQLVGRVLRDHEGLTVATKMGRRADPFVAEAYTLEAFAAGPTAAGATSVSTPSTSCRCTALRPLSTPTTGSTTHWTPWSTTA